MDQVREHVKKQIIEEELEKLLYEEYITNEIYDQVIHAQYRYYEDYYNELKDMLADDLLDGMASVSSELEHSDVSKEVSTDSEIHSNDDSKLTEPSSATEESKQLEREDYAASSTIEQNDESVTIKAQHSKPTEKTQPKKKTLSKQKLRERNIVWTLSIGVVFLLIAGTFLATSTWYLLPDIVKTLIITAVAGLFFGMALLTERVLKIAKTALAFYVLGALFLPIIIISIGFYGHLGEYLSFTGDGQYLLGALGSLSLLPIYVNMARKLHARLFIWFSYVSLTFMAGFFVGWLDMPIDGFYLGMILFNTALIFAYRYAKKQDKWTFFVQDFALYLQANLILTSALMIFFFDDAAFYGFNLIITAVLYLAMITVTNYRQYHYVFTLFLVYGAYQMIEHSFLHEVDAVLYALLGFVFILLPILTKDRHHLSKVFHYTSAIISGAAFLFISLQALTLTMGQSSIVLFVAYLLIAGNFLYLANIFQKQAVLFGYISAAFIMVGLYELVLIGRDFSLYTEIELPLFIMAFLYYLVFGCFIRHPIFEKLSYSSRDVSGLLMLFIIFIGGLSVPWWELSIMLLLLSVTALLMVRYETRWAQSAVTLGAWLHPVTFGFAVIAFYMDRIDMFTTYEMYVPTNGIVAGIAVLLLCMLWRQIKKSIFYHVAFYVAQIFYLGGMLQTFEFMQTDMDPMTRVIIMFGGILMAYILYRKTKWSFTPFYMGGVTLIFYLVSLYAIHQNFYITSPLFFAMQFVFASIFLFGIGYVLQQHDTKLRTAYYWLAHGFLPIGLWLGLFTTDESGFWAIILTGVIYTFSLFQTKLVPVLYFFLYGALSMIALGSLYFMLLMELEEYLKYNLVATIIIFIAMWFSLNNIWQQRMNFYMIPFMMISLMLYVIPPMELPMLVISSGLTVILVLFLFKLEWKVFTIIPLLLLYTGLFSYGMPNNNIVYGLLLGYAILLFVAGMLLYKKIVISQKDQFPLIDWFSVVGYISLFTLHAVTSEYIVDRILPDILIVIALWMQRQRFPQHLSKWMVFFAGVYILKPYYTVLNYANIPELIEMELYALPWIAVVVLLKKLVNSKLKTTVTYVEWAVLSIIAAVLMIDALNSGTIYDAVILGTLALISLLVGMNHHMKSYFFVGLIVLLLNFLLQTKPFWADMPWWVYLLVAGTLLITVASYNEWSKQKQEEGRVSKIKEWLLKIKNHLKEWD